MVDLEVFEHRWKHMLRLGPNRERLRLRNQVDMDMSVLITEIRRLREVDEVRAGAMAEASRESDDAAARWRALQIKVEELELQRDVLYAEYEESSANVNRLLAYVGLS